MLGTGARFSSNFWDCYYLQKFQDGPHGSAILNDKVDEGSTKAILADHRGSLLQTAILDEEDERERSSPV